MAKPVASRPVAPSGDVVLTCKAVSPQVDRGDRGRTVIHVEEVDPNEPVLHQSEPIQMRLCAMNAVLRIGGDVVTGDHRVVATTAAVRVDGVTLDAEVHVGAGEITLSNSAFVM